ncbi:hypothetical protein CR513_43146, partial [Mucuna pruriens]
MSTGKDSTSYVPHVHIIRSVSNCWFSLTMMDRSMIDAASGGALMDKTPAAARHLISNMASNTQQFGIKGASQPRMVNEIDAVDNLRLENQLTELTSLVSIAAKVCGICTSMEHPTNMCPTLQETESDHRESVGAISGYQYGKKPYQIWEASILAKAESRAICSSMIWTYSERTTIPAAAIIESASSRQLTISRGPDEVVSNSQPGVLANHELQQYAVPAKYERHHPRPQGVNRILARSNNLPSQTIPNLRGNASALPRPTDADFEPDADSQMPQQDKTVPLPFPTRTLSTRKPKSDEELLRMFQRVENQHSTPRCHKADSQLCKIPQGIRKKMKGGVEVGGIVSALTRNEDFTVGAQQALPKKCRDPKIFSIPCTIGDCTFADAMLDLGASINVMPTSMYKSLSFGDLEPTWMTIQLANRSVVQPLGILEDVLVQVNELIFPADFYVLDMEDETSGKGSTLILG